VNKDDRTTLREPNGRWLKGPSANPAGRPLSARQKISERLLNDLSEVWEAHGKTVLERLAEAEPKALAQIAYGVLPKDILIGVEHRLPMNLSPEDWESLVRVAATLSLRGVCASARLVAALHQIAWVTRAESRRAYRVAIELGWAESEAQRIVSANLTLGRLPFPGWNGCAQREGSARPCAL
jgi:hypothetical protein